MNDLLDEMSAEWIAVERAIWPDGPAHGHGSGVYAAHKAKVIAALRTEQEARARVEEAARAVVDDRRAGRDSDRDTWAALRAAVAPDASEGEK